MKREEVNLNIKKYISFHERRILLLKEFLDKKVHEKLIFQISFLGLESLARVLYQDEKNPRKRFENLVSREGQNITPNESNALYKFWRCSLVHNGFIKFPWTSLEAWGDDDESFLIFSNNFHSTTEFPAGSIIAIYECAINYFKKFFENKEIVQLSFYEN